MVAMQIFSEKRIRFPAANEEYGCADSQQRKCRWFRHGQGFPLEGQSKRIIQPGGKDASRSVWREFINVATEFIRLKQIARAVKGQSKRARQPGGKSAS